MELTGNIVTFFVMAAIVDLTLCYQLHSLLDCRKSKFGCCPDGVTDAYGWNKKGCSGLLCYDKDVMCKQLKAKGDCESLDRWEEMNELCPKSCRRCGNNKAASPPACYQAKYGCCYDGVTAAITDDKRPGIGCPFCRDIWPHTCKQFGRRHWCKGKWPRTRYFLKNYCFRQCGFCTNFKKLEIPPETPNWRQKFF